MARKKRPRLQTTVTPELARLVREEAKAQGMTISNYLFSLLREEIPKRRKTQGGGGELD